MGAASRVEAGKALKVPAVCGIEDLEARRRKDVATREAAILNVAWWKKESQAAGGFPKATPDVAILVHSCRSELFQHFCTALRVYTTS